MRVLFSLTHQDGVHYSVCAVCGAQYEFHDSIWSKNRMLAWNAKHRIEHAVSDMHDIESD